MTFIRTKQDVWQPFHKLQQQSHMIRKAQKTASLGIQVTCVIVCFWSWDVFVPLKGSTEAPGKVSQLQSYELCVSSFHLQSVQSCHLVLTSTGSGEHDLKATWHMFFLLRLKMQISKNTRLFWFMRAHVILVLGTLRQKDHKLEVSLDVVTYPLHSTHHKRMMLSLLYLGKLCVGLLSVTL